MMFSFLFLWCQSNHSRGSVCYWFIRSRVEMTCLRFRHVVNSVESRNQFVFDPNHQTQGRFEVFDAIKTPHGIADFTDCVWKWTQATLASCYQIGQRKAWQDERQSTTSPQVGRTSSPSVVTNRSQLHEWRTREINPVVSPVWNRQSRPSVSVFIVSWFWIELGRRPSEWWNGCMVCPSRRTYHCHCVLPFSDHTPWRPCVIGWQLVSDRLVFGEGLLVDEDRTRRVSAVFQSSSMTSGHVGSVDNDEEAILS